MMEKAYAYTRLSGKGQEAGDGIQRQKLAIRKFADQNNLEIVDWYHDTQTGKDEWTERDGWSAMVAALNGVKTIIVEGLHRVARVVLVSELILADLKKRQVTLLSSTGDDSDDDTPERVMFRQMLSVFNSYERTMIVMKLRGARQRFKAKNGKCEGRKKYGENPDKPEEVALRDRIITMASTHTHSQIASILNSEGIRSSTGKVWYPNVVARIAARQ